MMMMMMIRRILQVLLFLLVFHSDLIGRCGTVVELSAESIEFLWPNVQL